MNPDEQLLKQEKTIGDLQAQLDRKNKEIEFILKISADINASVDMNEIASLLLISMDEVFGFQYSMILLLEKETDILRVVATHGYEQQGIGSTVKVGQGVIGVVAQKKRLLRISGMQIQQRYLQRATLSAKEMAGETDIPLPSLSKAQSQIAIPMISKEDLVGVLSVESRGLTVLSKQDEVLVSILANQAAVAFQNARLNQNLRQANARLQEYSDTLEQQVAERTQELSQTSDKLRGQNEYLSALHDTSLGLLNRLDLNELLETLVSRAGQLLESPYGYIYLVEPEANVLELKVVVGISERQIGDRMQLGEGLAGKVWHTGQPVVVADYDNWSGRSPEIGYGIIRALAGVPLRQSMQTSQTNSTPNVVGVLGLGYTNGSDRTFGDDEVELLNRFAQLASIALDNARLFEAEQRQRQMAESLRQVAAVLSAHLDRDTVLSKIIEQLQRFIEYDSAVILLHEDNHLVISDLIGLPHTEAIGHRIPLTGNSPAVRAFNSGQPFAIANVQTDPGWVEMEGSKPIRSWMGIPLLFGETPIGVLTVNSVEINAYDQTAIQLVKTFANQAAIAIENARLFKETQLAKNAAEAANQDLSKALENLRTAQTQLVEAEKMVALGQLVAGVAHEINTPVGVGVTAASLLEDKTVAFRETYRGGQMKRTDLEKYLDTAEQSSQMILKNLSRAADLIQSFKQVAVDQSSEERREFVVKQYLEEILLSLRPQLKKTQHIIEINGDNSVTLDSYPGVFSQIVTNLIMNSLLHAYGSEEAGQLTFDFKQENGRFTLEYSDDGKGIPQENLAKIFDPFFTTKRGQGGSGLGLHIIYNLVTQKLDGTIRCKSETGTGTTFVIELPINNEK